MTDRSTIQTAVYDQLVDIMAARSDTPSEPDVEGHVVLDETDLPESPPALAVRWLERTNHTGIHDIHVATVERDANGHVTDIVFEEERTLDANVSCIARKDTVAVDVYEDVRQHFNAYPRVLDYDSIDPDIGDIECRDASPRDGDDRRAHLLRIDVDYEATFRWTDIKGSAPTPVEKVVQDITADGEAAPTRTDT